MNKQTLWFLIPLALLPYVALLALMVVFFSAKLPVCGWIMDSLFAGNGLYLVGAVLLYAVFAAVLSMLFAVKSIRKATAPVFLAKAAMIIKWCQVPAFLLIFVLGVMFAITLFTIPFALGLFLLDCLTVFLTGILTAAAAVNAVRLGLFRTKEVLWIVALQLVFCADVMAATAFYRKLKQRTEN